MVPLLALKYDLFIEDSVCTVSGGPASLVAPPSLTAESGFLMPLYHPQSTRASRLRAGKETEFVIGRDAGQPIHDGGEVNILGVDERLQVKVLKNGGEEQKQLHASQAFSDTHPLPCSDNSVHETGGRRRDGPCLPVERKHRMFSG